LLELCFPSNNIGLNINLKDIPELDTTAILFSEKIGLLLQSKENLTELYKKNNVKCLKIGSIINEPKLIIKHHDFKTNLSIKEFRDKWFKTSYLLDSRQTLKKFAIKRKNNLGSQPLNYTFPRKFEGKLEEYPKEKIKAAIIREKSRNHKGNE
jgi:phosphoribosylformylglycinamidine synthase